MNADVPILILFITGAILLQFTMFHWLVHQIKRAIDKEYQSKVKIENLKKEIRRLRKVVNDLFLDPVREP
jgi:hypothetical protein